MNLHHKFAVTLFSTSTLIAAPAYAQCEAFLTNGLQNIERSESTAEAKSMVYAKHCGSDIDNYSKSQAYSASVEVFGYGGGEGEANLEESRERIKSWCSKNQSLQNSADQVTFESRQYSQAATEAYQACLEAANSQFVVKPIISPDRRHLTIAMRWTGPTGMDSGVQLYGIEERNFSCKLYSNNSEQTFPITVSSQAAQIVCARAEAQEVVRDGTTYSKLPAAYLSVPTAGDPIQLSFAEEWDPGLPYEAAKELRARVVSTEVPVGTVIYSVLPPAKFLSANNPQYDSTKWALADGAAAPEGSLFVEIAGARDLPNLMPMSRASFLLDITSQQGVANGTPVGSLETEEGADGEWTWFAGLNDIQGREDAQLWEYGKDNFRVFVDDGESVIAQGATYTYKDKRWDRWSSGKANVLGFSEFKPNLYPYIKID